MGDIPWTGSVAKMNDIEVKLETPLKWPNNFGRTLIEERLNQKAWKKQLSVYVKTVGHELELLGARTVLITYNERALDAERDPGVAIWYSRQRSKDTSWQRVLRLDNPNPTREQIDKAFKTRVMEERCHPDLIAGGSGGDAKMYIKLDEAWRNAKAYIEGDNPYDLKNCLPMDRYVDVRQNMAGAKLYLEHLRAMYRLGNPFVVESMMDRGLHAALTSGSGEVGHGAPAA
jgi:hypothetical protein